MLSFSFSPPTLSRSIEISSLPGASLPFNYLRSTATSVCEMGGIFSRQMSGYALIGSSFWVSYDSL